MRLLSITSGAVMAFATLSAEVASSLPPELIELLKVFIAGLISFGTQWLLKKLDEWRKKS